MAVKDVNFETLSYIIHENKAQKRANHSAPPLKNPHKWDSSFLHLSFTLYLKTSFS